MTRWVGLATSTRPTARVPTTTRWVCRSSVTLYEVRPSTNRAAMTSGRVSARAITFSSVILKIRPSVQQARATPRTAHPIGEITSITGWMRRIQTSAMRSRRLTGFCAAEAEGCVASAPAALSPDAAAPVDASRFCLRARARASARSRFRAALAARRAAFASAVLLGRGVSTFMPSAVGPGEAPPR